MRYYRDQVIPFASVPDEGLMQAYLAGDARAFEELYRRHSGRVYAYLRKRLPSPEEADEVFQAVFLKAHRSRSSYQPKYPVIQWLFVIARTSLVDHLRKTGRNEAAARQAEADQDRLVSRTTPDQALGVSGGSEEDLLRQLPSEQKRVVEMRVLEDRDYLEIARQLGKTQASVRQIYSRAIRRLRALVASPQRGIRT
jgi:RNA polymerase sigma-70 factor, ECF subfamily